MVLKMLEEMVDGLLDICVLLEREGEVVIRVKEEWSREVG